LHYYNIGVKILQDQLEEERRLRVDLEARMNAEREALEARMSAERKAKRLRMSEILAYMQSLSAATCVALSLFSPPRPPPPPPDPFSTPVSMDKF
jgi:hypothetical protein